MILYVGDPKRVKRAVAQEAKAREAAGRKAGIIDFDGDAETAARLFFKELRRLDSEDTDVILAAGIEEKGIGIAVMNRMRNAADGNIINVE